MSSANMFRNSREGGGSNGIFVSPKLLITLSVAVLALCIAMFAVSDHQDESDASVTIDGINYELYETSHTAQVTIYGGSPTDVVIPQSVVYNSVTYSVTSILEDAYYNCVSLKSVSIPKSVTAIGQFAFQDCGSLSSVTFEGNSELATIGEKAFYYCDDLGAISIPASVTAIGKFAFRDCSSLSSVTFEGNSELATIGDEAFLNCNHLGAISIPASVTAIGGSAFYFCTSLSSVTFEKNSNLTTIGDSAFNNCGNLDEISIPASVTAIGKYAFRYCNLSSIVFEDAENSELKIIKEFAFSDTSVRSIVIPDSVTTIEGSVFNQCGSLETVTFGKNSNLTTLGASVFTECNSLKSIIIPDSVTSEICSRTFDRCENLESVVIGNGVPSFQNYAINECPNLTTLTIRSGTLKLYAIQSCESLASVTIDSGALEDSAIKWCDALASVTLGEGVTSVHDKAFGGKTPVIYCNAANLPTGEWQPYLLIRGNGGYVTGGAVTDGKFPQADQFIPPSEKEPFLGYNTKADGTGTSYAVGDTIPEGNVEVYAIWKSNPKISVTPRSDGLATITPSWSSDLKVSPGTTWSVSDKVLTLTDGDSIYTVTVDSVKEGYAFAYFTDNGTELGSSGTVTKNMSIGCMIQVPIPQAVTGLTYNGTSQTGVNANDGCTATGNTGTDAGDYESTASLKDACVWYETGYPTKDKSIIWSIAKKEVTVSGITASAKIYDGTVSATLDVSQVNIDGRIGSDDLSVSATGKFVDANAGTGKTVNIADLSLAGSAKENYVLAKTGQQASTTADITQLEATLVWTQTELVYNGSPQNPVAAVNNLIGEDECTVTVVGQQTDAGGPYTATASGLSNGNYKLPSSEITCDFTITPQPVTVTADDKVKTIGETDPELTATVAGLVDEYTISYELTRDSGEDIGTYAIRVTGTESQGNYSVTFMDGTLTIRPEGFTVTFDVQGHGTAPESEFVVKGEKATKPADPTQTGYKFGGWFKESACTTAWDFDSDTVTSDITLYAKWSPAGKPVEAVTIETDTTTIDTGEDIILTFTVTPKDAVFESVVWTSSDETVITVVKNADNSATVTGVKYGSATVTLKVDGKTATVQISVVYKPSKIDESKETAVIDNENTFIDEIRNSGTQNPAIELDLEKRERIEISKGLVDVIREKNGTLSVKTASGSVQMDAEALKALSDDKVTIMVSSIDIPSRAKGASAAVDASVLVNGVKKATEFGVPVLIGIAYELKDGQDLKDLRVYYLPDSGSPVLMRGAYYDEGTVWFETTHFSDYVVVFGELPTGSGSGIEWIVIAAAAAAQLIALWALAPVAKRRKEEKAE